MDWVKQRTDKGGCYCLLQGNILALVQEYKGNLSWWSLPQYKSQMH